MFVIVAFEGKPNVWKLKTSNSQKALLKTFVSLEKYKDNKETIEITNGRFDIKTATIDIQTFP